MIDYLPQILREVREYKCLLQTEQPEIINLWIALENALNDQFIHDATENGVLRLESILNITPKAADSLEDRKFRILARFNEKLPYTYKNLQQKLATLCGENGFTMELTNATYTLKVRIELVVKSQFDSVSSLLQRVVPANLIIDLDLRYNQYSTFTNYTHSQLSAYNHEQLRSEVIAQ